MRTMGASHCCRAGLRVDCQESAGRTAWLECERLPADLDPASLQTATSDTTGMLQHTNDDMRRLYSRSASFSFSVTTPCDLTSFGAAPIAAQVGFGFMVRSGGPGDIRRQIRPDTLHLCLAHGFQAARLIKERQDLDVFHDEGSGESEGLVVAKNRARKELAPDSTVCRWPFRRFF